MVGGVSFTGGVGSIPGAMLGLLFIALINNGMIIGNINAFWQPIFTGCILLGAVVLDVKLKGMGGTVRRPRDSSATEGGSEG
jgi:ABC-type xylose transport system permease subunit